MKRYQETMLKDFEILLPYILLLGVLVLLAISVYLLQDFTKIYQIYTILENSLIFAPFRPL